MSDNNTATTQERISSVFQITPTPISLALTIYEPDPLKSPNNKEGVDFSHHFVVQHYLSVPKRLKRTLAHTHVLKRLEEPLNNLDSSFLFKRTFDEALTLHLDKIFGSSSHQSTEPQQRSSEQRSRSRNPDTSKPRGPDPSSSSSASAQPRQEHRSRSRNPNTSRTGDAWQTDSSNDTWGTDSWGQSRWQPKEWSSNTWEKK